MCPIRRVQAYAFCFSIPLKMLTSVRLETLTAMLTQTASTAKAPITAFANLDLQEMEQLVQVGQKLMNK